MPGDVMPLRMSLVAVLALLSAACVHHDASRIGYFCQATLTNENGAFQADAHEARWTYDLGDGMQASLGLPHAWQSREDFRANGWGHVQDSPGLVITFDRRFARNEWMQTPARLSAFGEIRVGAQRQREWVSSTQAVVFMYSEWHTLLGQEGDLEVTLFETPDTVLQRGIIPRSALESLVPTLQRLSAEAIELERDPPANCTPYEEEEIIVT
jgi:hypothetical protein